MNTTDEPDQDDDSPECWTCFDTGRVARGGVLEPCCDCQGAAT